jgi:hypothetical protein
LKKPRGRTHTDTAFGSISGAQTVLLTSLKTKRSIQASKSGRARFVDASVFLRIPGFFIVSAIYMISEKVLHVILEDAAPRKL